MSATLATAPAVPSPGTARTGRSGPRLAARAEGRKLAAQLPVRLLAVACLLGPLVFAGLLKLQSGSPSDALYGAWVHSSGFALSLVVLGFAANWGFPIIAGVLAGDLFASEDRHGTWKTILTGRRSLRDVFAGKVLAALAFALALGLLLAVSSLVAGLGIFGPHPLLNLGGIVLHPGHLVLLLSLSWLICMLPFLAYTCLALLFSVASRNGILGVLGPILVALLTQLLALIGNGVLVHLMLIGSAFDAWHGLFAAHPFYGPLVAGLSVCTVWIAACLGASWLILRRREFIPGDHGSPRARWRVPVQIVAGIVVVIALLALAANWGPAGVTRSRLIASLGPEFHRLTLLQQRALGHPIPANAHYRIVPTCARRNSSSVGPGDWTCTMYVYVALPGAQPLTVTPVTYDVSVQSNGCYKAQSPPAVVGQSTIRGTAGQTMVNPLAIIYGCANVL